MKVDRKAKFIIFFTIAIVALGLSHIAAVFTGDIVSSSLPSYNETEKLIALDDDNFSPTSLNTVYEEKPIVEEVNDTDDANDTNSTGDGSDIEVPDDSQQPSDSDDSYNGDSQDQGQNSQTDGSDE